MIPGTNGGALLFGGTKTAAPVFILLAPEKGPVPAPFIVGA